MATPTVPKVTGTIIKHEEALAPVIPTAHGVCIAHRSGKLSVSLLSCGGRWK